MSSYLNREDFTKFIENIVINARHLRITDKGISCLLDDKRLLKDAEFLVEEFLNLKVEPE